MDKVKHEIVETIGIISSTQSGWRKELNLISWNDGEPRYDIRQWNPDHTAMGKGISMSREEAEKLYELMTKAGIHA